MKSKQILGECHSSVATFPKKYRLTKTDEYSSVFGFRKALKSSHFLLHYRIKVTEEATETRLGLVVAKKLLRRSVDRNLVRRLARENFRILRCHLPLRDMVLRLRVRPEPIDRQVLAEEIRALFKKTISPER